MCSKIIPWPLRCWGAPWEWGWSQDPIQMSGEVREQLQATNFDMPNNSCSMKYALKLVPGLADVGVPHGDGPRTPSRCLER